MGKIEVKLKRTRYGWTPKHQGTFRALGLRKREQTVVHDDNPVIRGMIEQVRYAIEIRELDESKDGK